VVPELKLSVGKPVICARRNREWIIQRAAVGNGIGPDGLAVVDAECAPGRCRHGKRGGAVPELDVAAVKAEEDVAGAQAAAGDLVELSLGDDVVGRSERLLGR